MRVLERQTEGLWTVAAPQTFYGLHVGTRMTVLRLPGGGLWLHSAIPISAQLKAEIDALGRVEHIVAPNAYHHLHARPATALWPEARVHAARELRAKRADLRIDAELSDVPDAAWAGALVPISIAGSLIHETVFVHRPTRTLITADLVENFDRSPHLPTQAYLKASGVLGTVGLPRLIRLAFRDRPAARRSLDRLLTEDFDRIVLAHGRILPSGGREAVRNAYRWLG